ncbi:MAG TPA: membrane dipeptidase [Thermoleophilaceae bacterium]
MIADLHCHYPMHVMMEEPRDRIGHMTRVRGRPLGDRVRAIVLRAASALLSDRDLWSGERVNLELLQRGRVRLVWSVLHSPFNEIDLSRPYGAPPESDYFRRLLDQLERVESHLATFDDSVATIVSDADALDRALVDDGPIAFVHVLEGGVDLGATPDEIERNVATLRRRGVAYVTLAHLFYRRVATNAHAIPFLPERVYDWVFRQPEGEGLTELGRAAVEAMGRNRILVDLAHMRGDAIEETFEVLDRVAPDMPIVNSHAGYRFGEQEYMLDAPTVERIARRRGMVGLILAQHQLNDGIRKKETETFEESFEVLRRHVDKLHEITGSHEYVGIGSDFDGFIKPTMGGIESMSDMAKLEDALTRHYGAADAELIASGNARRVLRELWRS